MNPIGNYNNGSNLSPQMMNNIKQVKNMMKMANGNPIQLLQQMNNPMANQITQMLQTTKNPEQVFMSMARQMGVDPNAIINELRK